MSGPRGPEGSCIIRCGLPPSRGRGSRTVFPSPAAQAGLSVPRLGTAGERSPPPAPRLRQRLRRRARLHLHLAHRSHDRRSARQEPGRDRRGHARRHRRSRGERRGAADRAAMGRRGEGRGRRSSENPGRRRAARPVEKPPLRYRAGVHRDGARRRGVPHRRAGGADPRRNDSAPRSRGLWRGADGGRRFDRSSVRARIRVHADRGAAASARRNRPAADPRGAGDRGGGAAVYRHGGAHPRGDFRVEWVRGQRGGGEGGGGGGVGRRWRLQRRLRGIRRRRRLLRWRCGREILTMAQLTVEHFADAVATALGGRLVALLLYGSAARGTHVPDRSDVNTLLICDAVDEDLFARLERPVRDWVKAGHPAPLNLTEREWQTSADAFPIEYEDIREAHRLLAGRDPWQGIAVRREQVRRQLEHELMGKLVRLRQAYAALRGDPKQLAQVIVGSAAGFFTMLRATLRLAGKTPPVPPDALVREAGVLMGFAPERLAALESHARGVGRLKLSPGDPLPLAYLAAVARVAELVNGIR